MHLHVPGPHAEEGFHEGAGGGHLDKKRGRSSVSKRGKVGWGVGAGIRLEAWRVWPRLRRRTDVGGVRRRGWGGKFGLGAILGGGGSLGLGCYLGAFVLWALVSQALLPLVRSILGSPAVASCRRNPDQTASPTRENSV
eukprot:scaffold9426_cov90-Isochrysis_galbana.AAC.7